MMRGSFNKWIELIRVLSDYHRNYLKKHGKENEHVLFILDTMQDLDKKEIEVRYGKKP